jgi:hypothetical protein
VSWCIQVPWNGCILRSSDFAQKKCSYKHPWTFFWRLLVYNMYCSHPFSCSTAFVVYGNDSYAVVMRVSYSNPIKVKVFCGELCRNVACNCRPGGAAKVCRSDRSGFSKSFAARPLSPGPVDFTASVEWRATEIHSSFQPTNSSQLNSKEERHYHPKTQLTIHTKISLSQSSV